MRKKILMTAALTACLTVGSTAAIFINEAAYAKNKPATPTVDAKKAMARYSVPTKKKNFAVRESRLSQQNIVAEAADVLNVLPIDIINEMKKGKTLEQVAKDKGFTEADFSKKLADLDKKTVDAAVKAGTITKEHGDAISSGRTDRIKNGLKEKAMEAGTTMDMGN